jgi:hypothetical protein
MHFWFWQRRSEHPLCMIWMSQKLDHQAIHMALSIGKYVNHFFI